MPDHRVNRTFTRLVNFLLSRAAFTMVSVCVYTRKIFTLVSKLQNPGKTLKSKHGISQQINSSAFNNNSLKPDGRINIIIQKMA